MPVNADKPHLWKADTRASVDQFNQWFMKFAPKAHRETRKKTIKSVEEGLTLTNDLTTIAPYVIKAHPEILPTLRMSTCPPLARDRLIGLADSSKSLVGSLEQGKVPPFMAPDALEKHLRNITNILSRMLDVDIFPGCMKSGDQQNRSAIGHLRLWRTGSAAPSPSPSSETPRRNASSH
jgi:XamI restriction endonuclease